MAAPTVLQAGPIEKAVAAACVAAVVAVEASLTAELKQLGLVADEFAIRDAVRADLEQWRDW